MASLAVQHVVDARPIFIGDAGNYLRFGCGYGVVQYQTNNPEQHQREPFRAGFWSAESHLFDSYTYNNSGGTIVNGALSAQTPVEVVALGRYVHGAIAFIAITQAITARGLPAAVVVGNDVLFTIAWVFAGSNPGDR